MDLKRNQKNVETKISNNQWAVRDSERQAYLRLGLLMLVAERSLGVEPTEPKPERLRVPLNPEVLMVSFFATYTYIK